MSDGGDGTNGNGWGDPTDIGDIGGWGEPESIGGLPGLGGRGYGALDGGSLGYGVGEPSRKMDWEERKKWGKSLGLYKERGPEEPTPKEEKKRKRRRRSILTEEEYGSLAPARTRERSILGG